MPLYFFKDWRKQALLTQDQLAEKIGVSGATVSRIETGERDFTGKYLEAFAAACGCDHPYAPLVRPPSRTSIDEMFPGNTEKDERLRKRACELAATLLKSHDETVS